MHCVHTHAQYSTHTTINGKAVINVDAARTLNARVYLELLQFELNSFCRSFNSVQIILKVIQKNAEKAKGLVLNS